ncbi:MAG: tRNA (guanosine(46)-N7)-methyltransferase TrmB [Chthoniobacterales bacterium]
MRTNKRTFPAAEVGAADRKATLDIAQVFARTAPLEVDLGCGDGNFLAALAVQHPDRNFLGVERMLGRVRASCRKMGDAEIPNARVLQADIMETLRTLLPPRSVDVCHLLFSDPWPKRRHHERRVFSEEFLRAVADVLAPGGLLRVATDHVDYFAAMERIWLRVPMLVACPEAESEIAFTTTFENRFRADGLKIHRLVLQRAKE